MLMNFIIYFLKIMNMLKYYYNHNIKGLITSIYSYNSFPIHMLISFLQVLIIVHNFLFNF